MYDENKKRFGFGQNWRNYAQTITAHDIDSAVASIQPFTRYVTEKDIFLDIGCGSGLFSLAASRLGFKTIRSFDFDENSVATTHDVLGRFAAQEVNWSVQQGSVLDKDFLTTQPSADMVYCWGVLHHTGQMWQALDNALQKVRPSGLFFCSLYNDQGLISKYWWWIKKAYVASPKIIQKIMVVVFSLFFSVRSAVFDVLRLRNPFARYHADKRGMKFSFDVVDWVGGYPFEVAKPDDVVSFCAQRGFCLVHIKTVGTRHGCNEYIFLRILGK